MLVIGMQYVFASPPASATPPACPSGQPGCDAPVNVGGTDQSKIGGGFGADWLQAFSIATLNTIGGTDVQIGGTANGIKVLDGDIATSNGDISAAGDLSATGAITGASLKIGADEVISSGKVGTFAGGVVVGDIADTATPHYLQVDAVNVNIPSASDCNDSSEFGRMVYDINTHFLYICGNDAVDITTGAYWRRVSTNTS